MFYLTKPVFSASVSEAILVLSPGLVKVEVPVQPPLDNGPLLLVTLAVRAAHITEDLQRFLLAPRVDGVNGALVEPIIKNVLAVQWYKRFDWGRVDQEDRQH